MKVSIRRGPIVGAVAVVAGVSLLAAAFALSSGAPRSNPHAGSALSYISVDQPHSWYFGYWSSGAEYIATTPILEVPKKGERLSLVSATPQTDGCPIHVVESRVYNAGGRQSYVQGSQAPWSADPGIWIGAGVPLEGLLLFHGSPDLWFGALLLHTSDRKCLTHILTWNIRYDVGKRWYTQRMSDHIEIRPFGDFRP